MFKIRLLLVSVVVLCLTLCGGCVSAEASLNSQAYRLTISVSTTSPSVGQTEQATVKALNGRGQVVTTPPLTFSSSNKAVATVSSTGLITAVATGSTSITVSSPGVLPASVTLRPVQPKLKAQTITFPSLIVSGKTFTATATASSGLPVTYTSTTPNTCSITVSGAGTELSAGVCTIQADQAGNFTYKPANPVTRSITVGQILSSISVTPANATAYPGFPVQFTALALDQFNVAMATQPRFTWQSSNLLVPIDSNGIADGSAVSTPDTTFIVASVGSVGSAQAVLTINPATLSTVTLSPSTATISSPSGSTIFSVTEKDQFGRPMAPSVPCTYQSDNTAAASIDPITGTATAQNGSPNVMTADISATCGNVTTSTALLTVDPQTRFAKTLVATPSPATVMQTQNTSVMVVAYDEYGAVFVTPMIDVDPGYNTSTLSATALNSPEGNQIVIQGLSVGSTTVHIHIDTDDSVATTFNVNVTPCTTCYVPVVTTITLTGGTTNMEYQGTTAFVAQAYDQNGGGMSATFTWASTDTTVLAVDTNGNVTATGVGTASITASSGSATGTSLPITVSPAISAPVFITSIYPTMGAARILTAPQGGRTEPITVYGFGFQPGATVTFGSDGTPVNTVFVSSTQLTVNVPAADLAVTTDTQVPIFVTNPVRIDYTLAVSNTTNFTIFTEGMVSITFDDAYESAYTNGIPIFNNAGIPVTAFIITGNTCTTIGTCPSNNGTRSDGYPWGWNNPNCPTSDPRFALPVTQWNNPFSGCLVGVAEGADYMTWAQVSAIADPSLGNEIGAHTRSHNSISTLNSADQVGEIQGASADLTALGFNVHTMAYPYGDYGCLTQLENAAAPCAKVAGNGTGTTAPVIGGLVQSAGYTGARSSDIGFEGDGSGNPAANLPIFLGSYAGDVTPGDAMTSAQLIAIVQAAQSKGAWVIFLFHRVDECNAGTFPYPSNACPGGQSPNATSIDDSALTGLASFLHTNGVRTVTVTQGLAIEGLNGQTQVPIVFPTE
jgi:peptidoglycan/xylan/chitin deacetylase (PgdA/CDA1 family)